MFKHTVTMETYGERIKRNPSATRKIVERKITADQILHLCKLLAEQSRAKSSFDRKQIIEDECAGGNSMEIQSEDITSSRSPEQDFCDRVNNSDYHPERILADSNVDTFSVVPTTTTITTTTTTTTTETTKQAKKDILNKIRNQIFERKRQKLAIGQKRTVSGVWRPW